MTEYFINVQCQPKGKQIPATFIAAKGSRIPISPEFDGLYELYPWMRDNGWQSDEDGNANSAWRVVKI